MRKQEMHIQFWLDSSKVCET